MSGGPELFGFLPRAHLGMLTTNHSTSLLQGAQLPHTNNITTDEEGMSLKQGRTNKRESKLNLRNIFGRQKPKRDVVIPEPGPPQLESPTSPMAGSSMADLHHWPYAADAPLSTPMLRRSSNSLDQPAYSPMLSVHVNGAEGVGDSRANKRASISEHEQSHASTAVMPWPPPPLCQAYQQSVKHAMMSMCTVPTETLQRLSSTTKATARKLSDANDAGKRPEPRMRLSRATLTKSPMEFASKIYVLTNSSWLFQYSADGDNDRPPERALRISKDSAAFASDLIPGRHWVIQVLSVADAAMSELNDSKGRKKSKGADKRQVSNFLLVCETPDDMESWLAVLRHEIEIVGGKKKASETGEPDESRHSSLTAREQPRFSQIVREDFSWTRENALTMDKLERTPDLLQDDVSTTASLVSSDGNNLDNLRDSSGNRFSVTSIDLRAFGTPPQSSPACSPTRSNFPSYVHDTSDMDHSSNLGKSSNGHLEIRARPNAAAILNRRQSRQTGNDELATYNARNRSLSVDSRASTEHEYVSAPQSIPNFSIPQAVSRRFSAAQTPAITISQPLPSSPPSPPRSDSSPNDLLRPLRKAPPTALPLSRPLSIVIDLPSPVSPNLPTVPSWSPNLNNEHLPSLDAQLQESPILLPGQGIPRKFGSLTNLQDREQLAAEGSQDVTMLRVDPVRDMERAQGLSPTCGYFVPPPVTTLRSSMAVEISHPDNYRHSTTGERLFPDALVQPRPSTGLSASATTTFVYEPRTSSLAGSRALATQRSMPILGDMPPPAPPPTCALPPVPAKYPPPSCGLPPVPPPKSTKRKSAGRAYHAPHAVAA